MSTVSLPQKRDTQFLGFDFGLRRIGVAIGDNITGSASSRPAITCGSGPNWPALKQEFERWKPSACVVGLPLNLDGSSQAMTRHAQRFARELKRRHGLPVYLCDERLSSREADSEIRLARADGRRSRKIRKGDRDSVAARLILEHWMKTYKAAQRRDPSKHSGGETTVPDNGIRLVQGTDRTGKALW